MRNWKRQYRFVAGGFEITDLHIAFAIEKSYAETENKAKISLWNLNEPHINALSKENTGCELYAGYGTNCPLIFRGQIISVETALEGGDKETSIEVLDGYEYTKNGYVSIAYKGKTSAETLISDTAARLGVPVEFSDNATFYNFPQGYSFIGQGTELLNRICASSGLTYSIQNGILQVTKRGNAMPGRAQLLNEKTGLIRVPKKIFSDPLAEAPQNADTLTKTVWGYEVEYFLNGSIGINDTVVMESKSVSGSYKVFKINMDGDNLEGDWTCTAQISTKF